MPGTWQTSTEVAIVAGSGYLRLIPVTANEKRAITSADVGTEINIVQVMEENVKIPDLAPKPEKKEKDLSTGVKLVYQLSTTRVDITSGDKIGEETEYSFDIKAVLTKETYMKIREAMSNPFVAVKGMGFEAKDTTTDIGCQYLLGYIKGIEYPTKGEIGEISIIITGGAPFTISNDLKSTFLQKLNTAIGKEIIPVGNQAITPITLDTGENATDLDTLLKGVVLEKYRA